MTPLNQHLKKRLPLLAMAVLALLSAFHFFLKPSQGDVGEPVAFFALVPDGTSADSLVFPDSSRLLRWSSGDGVELVLPELHLTSRVRASYDGDRITFSARESQEDSSAIWEYDLRTKGLKKVVEREYDSLTPSYLPDGKIVFSGVVATPSEEGFRRTAIFKCEIDGRNLQQISFNTGFYLIDRILDDGRILITAQNETGTVRSLALRPDGTELEEFLHPTSSDAGIKTEEFSERLPFAFRKPLLESLLAFKSTTPLPFGEFTGAELCFVTPRPRPPVLTSTVDRSKQTGRLLCLNVYDSSCLEEGVQVATVSIVDAENGQRIGATKVELDGSFFVEIPSDLPVRLELFDSDGLLVASQKHSIFVRPNENRGCIGCHEDRALTPENRVPEAVRKPPVEIALTKSTAAARNDYQ